ncbi:hypothetical protein [Roseovarius aestuariivivens]|uniref:hypothetical protein n=1 Tax=Roseovarius aestuariivivens TaxID=1888910 RepID=UPI001081D540|nr:hypothetical protein [Roseovarius aestuariivivens]
MSALTAAQAGRSWEVFQNPTHQVSKHLETYTRIVCVEEMSVKIGVLYGEVITDSSDFEVGDVFITKGITQIPTHINFKGPNAEVFLLHNAPIGVQKLKMMKNEDLVFMSNFGRTTHACLLTQTRSETKNRALNFKTYLAIEGRLDTSLEYTLVEKF